MSKHKGLKPPLQSLTPPGTGKMFAMPKQELPVMEITEIDFLKFKLAIQRDQNITASAREIENEQALLDQKKETQRLKTVLIRQENMKDIGHLQIRAGDNAFEENGKFFLKRANPLPSQQVPQVMPVPPVAPPSAPPQSEPTGETKEPKEGEPKEQGAGE